MQTDDINKISELKKELWKKDRLIVLLEKVLKEVRAHKNKK